MSADTDVLHQRTMSTTRPPHALSPTVDAAQKATSKGVTLVVRTWRDVEPGLLSWSFPNVAAALGAARALRNAVDWLVVDGDCEDAQPASASLGRVLASSHAR